MITGKTKKRQSFAKIAVKNFIQQTYSNKHLIIINEGDYSVIGGNEQNKYSNIIEIPIDKKGLKLTLGDLRNISLEMVPLGAIWTTWDDDDWRHDNYLETLYKGLVKSPGNPKYLLFKNRLDHNLNTKFSWRVRMTKGTFIVFAFKDPDIKYDELDSKEDLVVRNYILSKFPEETIILENDPKIYVRFVHNDNTSVYVNKNKKEINSVTSTYSKSSSLKEFSVTSTENNYITKIINMHFKDFVSNK